MDYSHMQETPPTRNAMSRRSFQQSGSHNNVTPATVVQRTPNQTPTAESLFGQTPYGFPNTHFSPDMMPFANAGPMTGPSMPQARLFWDSTNDMTQLDVNMALASTSFGGPTQPCERDHSLQMFNPSMDDQMNALALQSFYGVPSGSFDAFGNANMMSQQAPISESFMSTSASVDPAMLFSFSGPDLHASFGNMPQVPHTYNSRQPYETQTRDSIRERDIVKKTKGRHSRTSTNSSASSIENTRPALKRSSTEGASRKNRASAKECRSSAQMAASTIQRRPSPLKRQNTSTLVSIPEIRRPRTRLVIDETGRARTETVADSERDRGEKVRSSVSRDGRHNDYAGLWDEGDTESDEDGPRRILRQHVSLHTQQLRRSSSKHARAESGSFERAATYKQARPNSKASATDYDNDSFETIRPIRLGGKATRRFSMMDLPSSFETFQANEDQAMPDSPGDALGALKKVMAGRQQRIERASQNTLEAHNRRWAAASSDRIHDINAQDYGFYDGYSNSYNASPNTDGLTTPSTDRSSLSSECTRCICDRADEGQPMVQCESCTKWLHMPCIGLHSKNLPPVYVCVFCTGQTPLARGGRVRGPMPFESPLTSKSIFRQ